MHVAILSGLGLFLASYLAFHFFQWICCWVWAVLPAAQTVHWEAPATAWPLAS